MARLPGAMLLAVSAAGCATIFQGTSQTIPVRSTPDGASVSVFVDGRLATRVQTPATITLDRGHDVELEVTGPESDRVRFPLPKSLTGGLLADVLLAAPLPAVIDLVDGAAWKYPDSVDVELGGDAVETPPVRAPDLRLTAALMAGTGYGWREGHGDVNADTEFTGGGLAGRGHLRPELGLWSMRNRILVSAALRYQIVRGNTDVYATDRVYYGLRSAFALLFRLDAFLRAPDRRLQPFLSVTSGYGRIARLASGERQLEAQCGPMHDEICVDTVSTGPWLVGGGAGLRLRMTDHLHAVLAVDYLLGLPNRGFHVDGNLGIAAIF
jgi:hypothetical protein